MGFGPGAIFSEDDLRAFDVDPDVHIMSPKQKGLLRENYLSQLRSYGQQLGHTPCTDSGWVCCSTASEAKPVMESQSIK